MKRWYVVCTKAKNEQRAANNLDGGKIEVLAPKIKFKKYKEGKFVHVVEPMFPGYIFVKFHPVEEYRLVKYTRGIRTIVNFNGRSSLFRRNDRVYQEQTRGRDVATIQKKEFKKGEKIIIQEGPFKGFSGIFEKQLDGKERVAILLDGVGYCARMEIDRELVASA